MRILHVAPLVTPEGAYGGPITVALHQLAELSRRGHDVELVAGCQGFDEIPTVLSGVPVRLFRAFQAPGLGYAGLHSPRLLAYVRARARQVDVVHVHVARDLLSMPAALLAARSAARLVLQPHGMIDRSDRKLARVFDRLLTGRVFAASRTVLTLTDHEVDELSALGLASTDVRRVPNGIVVQPEPVPPPEPLEVLFLARLAARKRPVAFVEMAATLSERHPDVRFTMIGPAEGEAGAVQDAIRRHGLGQRVSWEGAVAPEDVMGCFERCSVYVLPAINEVFPMSVLEAMAAGRPVLVTTSCGLADQLDAAGAALVTSVSVEDMVEGLDRLLRDRSFREDLGRQGRKFVEENWGMGVVGDVLEGAYADSPEATTTEAPPA